MIVALLDKISHQSPKIELMLSYCLEASIDWSVQASHMLAQVRLTIVPSKSVKKMNFGFVFIAGSCAIDPILRTMEFVNLARYNGRRSGIAWINKLIILLKGTQCAAPPAIVIPPLKPERAGDRQSLGVLCTSKVTKSGARTKVDSRHRFRLLTEQCALLYDMSPQHVPPVSRQSAKLHAIGHTWRLVALCHRPIHNVNIIPR